MPCNQMKHKEGFSYIEVTVSLFIISLIGLLLFFSYRISIKSVNSSRKKINTEVIRVYTDTLLRNNIEKICIPFWIPDLEYSYTENSLCIGWVDGTEETKNIRLDERVKISSCKPIETKKNNIIGFEISYEIDGCVFETVAVIASRVYGEIEI